MCLHPIKIKNNAKRVNPRFARFYNSIPCGKCAECLKVKRDEWLVRSYFETLRTKSHNGIALFDTLTYNEENCPHFHGIKCFNHSHVVNFKKRLLIYLNRLGYHVTSDNLKLLICSEFGGTTYRPHYHLLCFCTFHGATHKLLHDAIHVAWGYGFTDQYLKIVDLNGASMGAIGYVTKYMTKSQLDLDTLAMYQKQAHAQMSLEEFNDLVSCKEAHSMFTPRHYQTNGFGDYFVELLQTDENIYRTFCSTGCVLLPDKQFGQRLHPIGHYLTYKILYDRVYNEDTGKRNLYQLNNVGIQFKTDLFHVLFNRTLDTIERWLPFCTLTKHLLGSRTSYDVALYSLLFQGRACTPDDIEMLHGFTPQELYNYFLTPSNNTASNPWLDDSLTDIEKKDNIEKYSISKIDYFVGLDPILCEIQSYVAFSKRDKQDKFDSIEATNFALRKLKERGLI